MPDVITDWLARYHIGAETSGLLVRLTAAVIVLLVCLLAMKITRGIFNSLLQVLEEGRLTDAQGRAVDFKNTVIIMTTNLGTRDIAKSVSLGFAQASDTQGSYDRMKAKVSDELKQHFRPEFLNRVDDIVVFHQLTPEEIVRIVDQMIDKVDERLRDKDMGIELTQAAKELLGKRGFDPVLGARPLRRTNA